MSDDDFDAADELFARRTVPKQLPKQRAALLKALGLDGNGKGVHGHVVALPADALQQFLPFVDAHANSEHTFDFGTAFSTIPQKVGVNCTNYCVRTTMWLH